MRVAIVLYDGCDELDVVGPYEVLRLAGESGMPREVRLVTLEPVEHVTASHGLRIVPQGLLDGTADLVIVPGGAWAARGEVGAWGEIQRGALPRALAGEYERGAQMAAVCTGTMLLAAAGIIRGRPATTHRTALDALRRAGVEVIDARVVDDGDLVTCGGVTSGIDMALWLVERHCGPDLAEAIALRLEHDRRGRVYRRTAPAGSG